MTKDKERDEGFTPGPPCRKCSSTAPRNAAGKCRVCQAAAQKRWRLRYPEKAKAQKRLYDARHPERAIRHKRERRARNPEASRAKYRQRLEWLAAGDVTREQLKAIYAAHDGRCAYCGNPVPRPRFTPGDPRGFDHVVPRSVGGLHTAENLVVACGPCNSARSDKGVSV